MIQTILQVGYRNRSVFPDKRNIRTNNLCSTVLDKSWTFLTLSLKSLFLKEFLWREKVNSELVIDKVKIVTF